jgi:DNA-binding MarR family transcriptional regulator
LSEESAVRDGHELGMLLRKAYLAFHRRANLRTTKQGVTADQYVLLTVLAREEGITQTTIVERTASDPNTVAAVLRLLERKKLVRREADADDRRARRVFLTPKGRDVQRRAAREAEPILEIVAGALERADAGAVERFLRRVHAEFSGKGPEGGDGGESPVRDSKSGIAAPRSRITRRR